jgi:putative transposase
MPRIARIVVPGASHHIVQRGNNRQEVFFGDDDRQRYLELLHAQGTEFGFRLQGYCLMTNHVHLIGVPEHEESLAKAVGLCHYHYTKHVNRVHRRSGHLWHNRFYSCPMDEAHTHNALAYVELNPLRAGMVQKPWDYPWSSAAAHCGKSNPPPWLDTSVWQCEMTSETWIATLRAFYRDDGAADAIRINTYNGRPLGSERFVKEIELRLGRKLGPLPMGRPLKWK